MRKSTKNRILAVLLILSLSFILSSCGGGGGGGVAIDQPTPPVTTQPTTTTQPSQNNTGASALLGCSGNICVTIRQENDQTVFESDDFNLLDGAMIETNTATDIAASQKRYVYRKNGQYANVSSGKSFTSKEILRLNSLVSKNEVISFFIHKIAEKDVAAIKKSGFSAF